MAQSRLERVASIFKRVTQLHKAQNLPAEDLPLWYNIYKSFPPKYDPQFNRNYGKKPIQPIFYAEDKVRARFQDEFIEASSLSLHNEAPSVSQQFLNIYHKIAKQEKDLSEDEVYQYAVNQFKTEKKQMIARPRTRTDNKKTQKPTIDLSNLFENQ